MNSNILYLYYIQGKMEILHLIYPLKREYVLLFKNYFKLLKICMNYLLDKYYSIVL